MKINDTSPFRQAILNVITIEQWAKLILAGRKQSIFTTGPGLSGFCNANRQEAEETELEAILAVFAGYVLDTEIVKQILRWEMTIVKESPIIQELLTQECQLGFAEGLKKGKEKGLEQGLKKGEEEGLEKGERRATLKGLHQIL